MRLSLQDPGVRRALGKLAVKAMDLKPALTEFGSYEVASTQRRIEQEIDPEGDRWPELAMSTQLKRTGAGAGRDIKGRYTGGHGEGEARGADHMLRAKGLLFASLTYLASRFDLAIGSNRIYAALQQFGGNDDMPPGPAAVPARPYLGFSNEDEEELGFIVAEHLGSAVP